MSERSQAGSVVDGTELEKQSLSTSKEIHTGHYLTFGASDYTTLDIRLFSPLIAFRISLSSPLLSTSAKR